MKIIISTILLVVLGGCGTRDYEKPPPDGGPPMPARQNEPRADKNAQPRLITEPPQPGYLWRGMKWAGVHQDKLDSVKCSISDSLSSNRPAALGTALISGAVIGVIGKFNGAWLFVTKDEPNPPGNWFWNNLDVTIKKFAGGAARGAIYVGGCETLLAGGNLTWFSGLLGQNYSAASTAAAIAVFSAVAAAPSVKKHFGTAPLRPIRLPTQDPPPPYNGPLDYAGNILTHLRVWSVDSDLGRGLRYRFVPGVIIVGIGGGIGYLVYDHLAGDGPADPACKNPD